MRRRMRSTFSAAPRASSRIAQAVVYVATAPKSNAVYTAFKAAMKVAKERGSLMPPNAILNGATR